MTDSDEDLANLIATGCTTDFVESVKRVVIHLLKYDPQVYMLVCGRARDVVDAMRQERP